MQGMFVGLLIETRGHDGKPVYVAKAADQINYAEILKFTENKSLYQLLGFSNADAAVKTATNIVDDIKVQYKAATRALHSDRNANPLALEVLKKLNNAYGCLTNDDSKADYDASAEFYDECRREAEAGKRTSGKSAPPKSDTRTEHKYSSSTNYINELFSIPIKNTDLISAYCSTYHKNIHDSFGDFIKYPLDRYAKAKYLSRYLLQLGVIPVKYFSQVDDLMNIIGDTTNILTSSLPFIPDNELKNIIVNCCNFGFNFKFRDVDRIYSMFDKLVSASVFMSRTRFFGLLDVYVYEGVGSNLRCTMHLHRVATNFLLAGQFDLYNEIKEYFYTRKLDFVTVADLVTVIQSQVIRRPQIGVNALKYLISTGIDRSMPDSALQSHGILAALLLFQSGFTLTPMQIESLKTATFHHGFDLSVENRLTYLHRSVPTFFDLYDSANKADSQNDKITIFANGICRLALSTVVTLPMVIEKVIDFLKTSTVESTRVVLESFLDQLMSEYTAKMAVISDNSSIPYSAASLLSRSRGYVESASMLPSCTDADNAPETSASAAASPSLR